MDELYTLMNECNGKCDCNNCEPKLKEFCEAAHYEMYSIEDNEER